MRCDQVQQEPARYDVVTVSGWQLRRHIGMECELLFRASGSTA